MPTEGVLLAELYAKVAVHSVDEVMADAAKAGRRCEHRFWRDTWLVLELAALTRTDELRSDDSGGVCARINGLIHDFLEREAVFNVEPKRRTPGEGESDSQGLLRLRDCWTHMLSLSL